MALESPQLELIWWVMINPEHFKIFTGLDFLAQFWFWIRTFHSLFNHMCLFTYTSTKNIKRNIKLRKLTTKITNLNVDVMIRVQIVQLTCPPFFCWILSSVYWSIWSPFYRKKWHGRIFYLSSLHKIVFAYRMYIWSFYLFFS